MIVYVLSTTLCILILFLLPISLFVVVEQLIDTRIRDSLRLKS